MGANKKRRAMDNIKFSIGAKLITIISFIVIISLGSITALVSWLVQSDLRISAEENNFEINRRSAMEAESTIANIRSNSRLLLQTVSSAGAASALARESVDLFVSENQHVAALFFATPGKEERILINKKFFSSRDIDEAIVSPYILSQRDAIGRAVRGETVLLNAAPDFARPVLALFFPALNDGVGITLFSSESLSNNFGFGLNQSYMINTLGDILVHSDFSLVRSGENIADMDFIRAIMNSTERNRQQLIETDFGFSHISAATVRTGIFAKIWEKVEQFVMRVWDFIVKREIIKKIINLSANSSNDENKSRQFMAYTKLSAAGAVVITGIEYDMVFEGIAATTRRNIMLTVAVLSISIIFIWFFSKTISIPLKDLAYAARSIEGGKFNLNLKPRGKDEIGILNSSFQKMCSALNIFGRFTNKEIAVKAMRGEIKPGGLPKHGTVFFSDIREFTAKSENFTKVFGDEASDKIVHWLNEYFTKMIECVENTNGVVDKFIGDAVMAHWGTAYSAGSPRKDAFNCVKAALMMRRALFFMNQERRAGDHANPSIRIGCGINTGIVTAGQLGSDMRMEYTVIGDPVNLASRIEALTKPLGADILISENTWRLVGDKFITEEMPSVTVKGKEKPVRIFAVVNFAGEYKGPQSLSDVRKLLGIEAPELSKVDVNADEKKYKIGT